MLALVAAFGVRQIKDVILQRFVVRSAIVVSLAITLIANVSFLQQTSAINLKNASAYLNSLDEQSASVIVLPQSASAVNPGITLPILDYYTDKELLQIDSKEYVQQAIEANRDISPLRFTWEVKNYQYPTISTTALSSTSSPAIVLISGNGGQAIPKNIEELLANHVRDKTFALVDRVFRFQSIVTVYRHNKYLHNDDTS